MGLVESKLSQLKKRGSENTHKLFFDVYKNTVNILKPSKFSKDDVDDHYAASATEVDVNNFNYDEKDSFKSEFESQDNKIDNELMQTSLDTNHNMLSSMEDHDNPLWSSKFYDDNVQDSGNYLGSIRNNCNSHLHYSCSENEVTQVCQDQAIHHQLNRDNVVAFYNSFPVDSMYSGSGKEIGHCTIPTKLGDSVSLDKLWHSDREKNDNSIPYWCSCSNPYCNYTCHMRCSSHVTLNCNLPSVPPECRVDDLNMSSCEATLPVDALQFGESGERLLTSSPIRCRELQQKITTYNTTASPGKEMILSEDGQSVSGFIRVHMNLCRPINVVSESKPLSLQNIIHPSKDGIPEKTLTSFYLPRDTIKSLHVNSMASTQEVISALLKKFKVADNPRKYALYERFYDNRDSMRVKMRRLQDNEHPLLLSLVCGEIAQESMMQQQLTQQQQFVLQENDTGDIPWDAFSLPELNNFLKILKREEEEYLNQVRLKYKYIQVKLQEFMDQRDAVNVAAQEGHLEDLNVGENVANGDSDFVESSNDGVAAKQNFVEVSEEITNAKEQENIFPSPPCVYASYHSSSQLLDVS